MKFGRYLFGGLVATTLFFTSTTLVKAALTSAQKDNITNVFLSCAVTTPPSGCFTTTPTGTIDKNVAVTAWQAQLTAGTIPAAFNAYISSYYSSSLVAVQRTSLASDLNEWKASYNPTTTGANSSTSTAAQGALLSGMKKPSDYAVDALDTSNFLQQDTATYGWSTQVWQTMRQMSNILIVVFLFLGALATTLNYNLNTYGIKRILPSVVQAAIVANFSYLLINAAIEGVGLAQKGLLGLGTGAAKVDANTWETLAAPLSKILDQLQPTSSSTILNLGWGLIAALAVGIAMIMLWLSVGILYLRSFILAMLVAFAPLAILSMAFPATQGVWKKWWEEFSKWLLLPLIVCFWLMVASMISGVAALPLMLKVLVTMIAVFQGVRAPFTFKPAIAGAAIGYAAAKLTSAGRSASQGALNAGKDLGTRALYANNVTGGALRGYDRWKGAKSASLASLKDSKAIMRTPSEPTADSSGVKRFMWNVGFRGRVGRWVNAEAAALDIKSQLGQAAIDRQAAEARAQSLAQVGLTGTSRGQALRAAELHRDRAQAQLSEQEEQDQVAAAEANPELMRQIAALNTSKDALSSALESMKTGAQAAALATDKNLQAEKKLAEFRKNEAANKLKTIESEMNMEALDENSDLGRRISAHFAGPANAALRRTMASYGVRIDDTGRGFVEGAIQNQVYSDAASGAYETALKIKQVNIAAQDSMRHGEIGRMGSANTAATVRAMHLNPETRQAIASHLHSRLKGVLTEQEMTQYGLSDPVALAGNNAAMAQAINMYNNVAPVHPNVAPDLSSRLHTLNNNQQAINRKQKKMVSESVASNAQTLSETSNPVERMTRLQDLLNNIVDDGSGRTIDMNSAYGSFLSGGREGSIRCSNASAATGTAHAGVLMSIRSSLKSLRNDAVGVSGGTPDDAAIEQLISMLTAMNAAAAAGGVRLPANPTPGGGGTVLDGLIAEVSHLRAEYEAHPDDNNLREAIKKQLHRTIIANSWLNNL